MRFSSNRLGAVVLACVPALGLVPFVLTNCSTSSSTASMSAAYDAAVTDEASASGANVVRSSATRQLAVDDDLPVAVNANNAFALDLYAKTSPSANGGNFLLSPISADLALTMTYAGAKGTTASQMASVLHIPSGGPSIFDAQNALTQALASRGPAALKAATEGSDASDQPSPSDYQLAVVNEVWGQTGYTWEAPFLTILAADYGTGVYTEDFSGDPSTAEAAINAWVNTETAGKINPLLPPMAITHEARLVLVNAIHLKLPWESAFDPSATRPQTFTRGDGSTEQTDFMSQAFEGSVAYAETGTAQLVSVPLAGDVSVVFALPKADLSTLTSSLTPDMFSIHGSAYDEVILNVPKFSFTSSPFSLAMPLKALGMTDAFSDTADFTGLCANPPNNEHLKILDVYQRASLDVAEGGVEAAAATAVIVGDDSGATSDDSGTPTSITVTLDRPFVVAVVDATGAILFLGQIADPATTGS